MAHKKPPYRIVTDYSFNYLGYKLPKGSIYGTFTGYTSPVKWIVPKYPETVYDHYVILVNVTGRWEKAYYRQYKKLCLYLDNLINSLGLLGKNTQNVLGKITFSSSAPYGRPRKITGLKTANKLYLARADHGQGDFVAKGGEPLRRTTSGDLEVSDVSRKNIVYN